MSRRLAEVARQVGVSEATVSRVLNGRPGVSAATRETVLTALDVLGYERPTKLRGESARLVGLVLPELTNPIFPAFAEVVGGALAQQGYTPVLCALSAGGVSEEEYVDLLLGQRVSGIVFAGGNYARRDASHSHYKRLAERGLPVVLLNASIEDLPFPRVVCDDEVAMEQAFGHLVALGHTRIGLVLGPVGHVPSERKLAAALTMAQRTGVEVPETMIARSGYGIEAGQAAATRLLKRGATGLICASDPIALGSVRAVRRAGLSTPADVSVVGYDDSALMMSVDPPLTTIRQPIDAMGRAAIELLNAMTRGSVDTEELLFEPELIVRASTGAAPR